MQKRLVQEIAQCRGGPNRLKRMRGEFIQTRDELLAEVKEIEEILDLIDEVSGAANPEETSEVPVDSLGE